MKIRNESLFEVLANKNSQLISDRTSYDKYGESITSIINEIKNNKVSDEKFIDLINEFHKIGLFREAIEACCEAISRNPFNWIFHLLRGYNNLYIEQISEAAAHLELAIRMNPDSFEARFYCGIAYYLLDNYPKSNYSFDQAVEIGKTVEDKCDALSWYWISSARQNNLDSIKKILNSLNLDLNDEDEFTTIDICKLYRNNDYSVLNKLKTTEQVNKYKYFIAWYEIINGNQGRGYSLLNECIENNIYSIQSVSSRKDMKKTYVKWMTEEFNH